MPAVRPTTVAGVFYPDQPDELESQVRRFIANGRECTASGATQPFAVIAPHAGYVYSGPIAGSAYRLMQNQTHIEHVVLLGPSHRYSLDGIALPSAEWMQCPTGNLEVDRMLYNRVGNLPAVRIDDAAHALEHSLEVHFPFIRATFPQARILPLAVGRAAPETIAEIITLLRDDASTRFIISSDLSHFLNYKQACERDRKTSDHIEQCAFESIGYEDACGRNSINGLLYLARELDMRLLTVDVRNSGDTAGSRDRVVGYGAYGCYAH